MSPPPSIAALPIQRLSEDGENVPCWKMLHAPVVLRSSYQRTPAWPETFTVSFITSASCEPRFRYAKRYIGRSAIASSQSVKPSGSPTKGAFVVEGAGGGEPRGGGDRGEPVRQAERLGEEGDVRAEGGGDERVAERERRVGGRRPVDVERPDVQRVGDRVVDELAEV